MNRELEDFESIARERRPGGTLGEVWLFLLQSKKWWLLPIVLTLGMLTILVVLSTTGAGPFIYALF